MGCGSSTPVSETNASASKITTTTKPAVPQEQALNTQTENKQMSSTTPAVTPAASGAPVTKVSTSGTASKYRPVLSKKAQAAPAPGVKNVRAAYSGKGWAPPQKEWDSSKVEKGDKVKIEIEDEWDDDGNLIRTITKKTTTPDWKFKTEKTVETYSAEEAKKAGLAKP